jgi:hypothetical protein
VRAARWDLVSVARLAFFFGLGLGVGVGVGSATSAWSSALESASERIIDVTATPTASSAPVARIASTRAIHRPTLPPLSIALDRPAYHRDESTYPKKV